MRAGTSIIQPAWSSTSAAASRFRGSDPMVDVAEHVYDDDPAQRAPGRAHAARRRDLLPPRQRPHPGRRATRLPAAKARRWACWSWTPAGCARSARRSRCTAALRPRDRPPVHSWSRRPTT
ncbi:MAG: hypothetical protein MZV64_43035 [Ignavibacteriales bacterium]|nr:hypothetical protein [Ignavibacteriales bacterium]